MHLSKGWIDAKADSGECRGDGEGVYKADGRERVLSDPDREGGAHFRSS